MNATQLDMFSVGLARRDDPETSKAAAARQRGGWDIRLREWFRAHPEGATDRELIALFDVAPEHWGTVKTARSRVTKLTTGVVRDGQAVHILREGK